MSYDTFNLGSMPPRSAVNAAGVFKLGPPRSTAKIPKQTPAMHFHTGTSYIYSGRADPEGVVVNGASGYEVVVSAPALGVEPVEGLTTPHTP